MAESVPKMEIECERQQADEKEVSQMHKLKIESTLYIPCKHLPSAKTQRRHCITPL
jgi:hypothetical protein